MHFSKKKKVFFCVCVCVEEEKKKQKCLPKFSEIFLLQKESKFLLNLFEFFFLFWNLKII